MYIEIRRGRLILLVFDNYDFLWSCYCGRSLSVVLPAPCGSGCYFERRRVFKKSLERLEFDWCEK